jgi:hypothetical protein
MGIGGSKSSNVIHLTADNFDEYYSKIVENDKQKIIVENDKQKINSISYTPDYTASGCVNIKASPGDYEGKKSSYECIIPKDIIGNQAKAICGKFIFQNRLCHAVVMDIGKVPYKCIRLEHIPNHSSNNFQHEYNEPKSNNNTADIILHLMVNTVIGNDSSNGNHKVSATKTKVFYANVNSPYEVTSDINYLNFLYSHEVTHCRISITYDNNNIKTGGYNRTLSKKSAKKKSAKKKSAKKKSAKKKSAKKKSAKKKSAKKKSAKKKN